MLGVIDLNEFVNSELKSSTDMSTYCVNVEISVVKRNKRKKIMGISSKRLKNNFKPILQSSKVDTDITFRYNCIEQQ
jgi:hypothetical protein